MERNFFGDPGKSRRPINLGGASTTASHASIIDSVKARREERQNAVKKSESALKIQAWWRGRSQSRRIREQLRAQFDAGDGGVLWTRCLVVSWAGGPADEQRLARWSTVTGQDNRLLAPFSGVDREAWRVLIRQICLLLIKSVAYQPRSLDAAAHLRILGVLLDSKSLEAALPGFGSTLSTDIASYLLHRGLYHHIGSAFSQIPIEAKDTPSIPQLIDLSTVPFSIFRSSDPQYIFALHGFTLNILTLSLLPNRLPIPSLTKFASRLPFSALVQLDPVDLIASLASSQLSRIHLLANLLVFGPARLSNASDASAPKAYLPILAALLDSFPVGSLEPPPSSSSAGGKQPASWHDEDSSDSDSDNDAGGHKRESRNRPAIARVPIDSKTQTRLNTLHSSSHISAILNATTRHPDSRSSLFAFLTSLWAVCPSKRDRVMSIVIGGGAGAGLVREVWRGYVRGSRLGKEEDPKRAVETFTDPSNEAWAPFLFLTELYTHTLLTMGDDEFFSSSPGPSSRPGAAGNGNPLSLDELTAWSRQLLNIAFPLYWHEDQANVKDGMVPGTRWTWAAVRDKVTKCLQAIHARDSRRPFTPADHWLVTGQIDMLSFIEAAVAEEQELDRPTPAARVLSKRQMAFISPRLGVLNNIPFAIPFGVRVQIFRNFIANDAHSLGLDDWYSRPKHRATIRRKHIAQDGFDQLGKLGPLLKEKVSITFIDEWGNEEAGIDGGGVFKEFLTSLTKEAFDSNRGLWLSTTRQELYPASHSYAKEPHQLDWYRFIGRVLGKALYEGILIDVAFASFFLGKWLGKQSYLDDLQSLDPELYQGLVFLKHYQGKVEDLSLYFTITNSEFGVTKSIDLVPNGSNTIVTKDNRIEYIYRVANYRLNVEIKKQSEALFEGVAEMIDQKWLRMFNQQELQILIGGIEEPVDIDDLMRNCIYGGVYDSDHAVIQRFWKVARTMNQKERQQLLRFVTSCSRPPLLGFKELNPHFSIRDAGLDNTRLPTSSTCVNLLKLPQYASEATLRQKLLQAISSNAGFDLS